MFIKQSLKGVNGVQFLQRMAIKPTRVGNCTAVSKRVCPNVEGRDSRVEVAGAGAGAGAGKGRGLT